MRLFSALATSLAVLTAPACDSDGGTTNSQSSGIAVSGATGSTRLADLSLAQMTELCVDGNAYQLAIVGADLAKRGSCTLVALGFTRDEASCEATVTACMAAPDDDTSGDESCAELAAQRPPSCNATIAEVEACLGAEAAALKARLGAASCADAGEPDASGDDDTRPAACQTVEAACPGFFGD